MSVVPRVLALNEKTSLREEKRTGKKEERA